ncbi:hypothetical protein KP509_35G021200 [Ceratopteris richardii]|uniref:Uncharacterized protein n=1 Tax=Ceratopteris richardii TaxID=49495 RepID=A0A8T2QF52_CERRI|nr:hypothetical protein KP509_35G021200 [Ceratopteris richardii]
MTSFVRVIGLVFVVLVISNCVESADVDDGRKLIAGSEEQEPWMMKEHYHKGWDHGRKGCHGKKGGWKKGHGKDGDFHGKDGHSKVKDKNGRYPKGGYDKQYPGSPH